MSEFKSFFRPLLIMIVLASLLLAPAGSSLASGVIQGSGITATGDLCYAVADFGGGGGGDDHLVIVDRTTGGFTDVGNTGTTHIEAAAWDLTGSTLYVTDRDGALSGSDRLGTLNTATGLYTPKASRIGTISGSLGSFNPVDVDGLAFEPGTGYLYAVHRRESTLTQLDLLFRINPSTGVRVAGAFGGQDYVVINTAPLGLYDVDDISFDPLTGQLYGNVNGTSSSDSVGDHLIKIDKATGAVTDVARLTAAGRNLDDMEGLSFSSDGQLYGTTGDTLGSSNDDSLWRIDKSTGVAQRIIAFPQYSDYESVACAPAIALTVSPNGSAQGTPGQSNFYAHTLSISGVTDVVLLSASSSEGWTTRIYQDVDGDGIKDPEDSQITQTASIGPSATYAILVEVVVPPGAVNGTVDFTTVTATGQSSGLSDSTFDTTTIGIPPVPDPVLDGNLDPAYGLNPRSNILDYCDASGEVLGRLETLYDIDNPDYVWIALEFDRTFVDNTYGDNVHQSWIDAGKSHSLGNLDGSDRAQIILRDSLGNIVFDFTSDYVESNMPTISGWGSAGVTGGEGSIAIGDPNDLLIETSIGYDLNTFCTNSSTCVVNGVDLFQDSPPVDINYVALDPAFSDWQYSYMYEVRVDASAFTNGYGSASIDFVHASPNKVGSNEIPVVPCTGSIGDRVWRDNDLDGIQDVGEPGINGVLVRLYRDNGDGVFDPNVDQPSGAQFTSGNGDYDFTGLGPDTYFVDVVNSTVPNDHVLTTANDPTLPINLGPGEDYNDADFGYATLPSLEISKELSSGEPAFRGQEIVFTIRITNTGNITIEVLPLQDIYDPADLDYTGATPASDDLVDDGVIDWSDLTTSFGTDLAPGQSFQVEVRFQAAQPTVAGVPDAAQAAGTEGFEPLADPVVDGLLDADYSFLQRFDLPATDTPSNLYGYTGANTCYWALVVDRGFNDNVYAESDNPYLLLDGWDRSHKFNDLKGSDKAVFNLTYSGGSYNGLTLDYLNDNGDPWASGQTGGDGSAHPGTPPISAAMTSLHWNLENSNWDGGSWLDPLKHSPPFNYNQTSGNYWEWHMIYEFSIPKNLLGGTCGTMTLASAHNSPSKLDTNLATIGDLVWDDVNRNGVRDPGEPGLPGVTVDLYQGGTKVRTTLTEPGDSGFYQFVNLAAGTYTVDVDETTLPPNYTLTTNNEPMVVVLTAGQDFVTADFGYSRSNSSLGDRVFYDINGDGLPDNDPDPGLNGVVVDLYQGACPANGDPFRSMATSGNGDYDFINLAAGTYCVDVDESTLPGGLSLTTGNEPLTVNLGNDQDYNLADFGYRVEEPGRTCDVALVSRAADQYGVTPDSVEDHACVEIQDHPGAIGDYVWYDSDGDAIQDVGEPGIGNVTLDLYLDDGNGIFSAANDIVVATTVTDVDGGYLFGDLPPGTYFVDVTDDFGQLTGLVHTVGPESRPDPDGPITLQPGDIYRDADFGYWIDQPNAAVVGDTVWYDGDGDGIQDPGEPGIPNVLVLLINTGPNGQPGGGDDFIADSATTDQNGNYLFTGVAPGTYFVDAVSNTVPAGLTASPGAPDPTAPFTVGPGDTYLDADIGFLDGPGNILGDIGGTVWDDTADNDGRLDAGEPRLPGVSVSLVRDDDGDGMWDAGEPIIATDTTDSNGDFSFGGLPADDYLVIVSDTQNVLDDYDPTVPGPNPGQDNNNQAQPYAIDLPAGGSNTTADFGYVQNGQDGLLGIIGNQVWYEGDGDGLYEPDAGDIGVAGVTVELLKDGQPYASTTTGAGGDYVFTSLPAGNYQVLISDDFGVLDGYVVTQPGPNPGQDNNNQAQPYAITLPDGGMNMTADFGYTLPGAIGDLVWYDPSDDGVQDVGEPGIANVTLNLYEDSDGSGTLTPGDTLVATTVTDADGGYLFPGLSPGDYIVDVTDNFSQLAGLDHVVANQSQSDPSPVISLGGGEVYKDADFGYVDRPGTGNAIIGDTVWYDDDGDGFQQPEEPGIPGIQVCATPINGGTPICTTTDQNGHYLLEVPQGAYSVAPTSGPAGLTATTTQPISPVVVLAGDQYLEADFGYNDSPSNPLLGTIGNLVFLDQARDGVFNAGDTPLGGVSVDLIRDSDGDGVWDPGEPIIATTTTDSSLDGSQGNYLFRGLTAGRYLVHVSDTNGVLIDYAKSPLGPNPSQNNNNQVDPYPVRLISPGNSNLTADFGYYAEDVIDSGVIGNQVWIEDDLNGVFDPADGDYGQHGVTVELLQGGSVIATTTTGASGDYAFVHLPGGSYRVRVSDTAGVLTGLGSTTFPANQASDHTNKTQPYGVNLPQAGENLTADFGYRDAPGGGFGTSTIGNLVWQDLNADGTYQFGEPAIGGVTVVLWYDANSNCTLDAGDFQVDTPQTTDPSISLGGNYLFQGEYPAGNYIVEVTDQSNQLAGYTQSLGTSPGSDGNSQAEPYCVQNFNPAEIGDTNITADFGYYQPACLGGVTWLDSDGDGVYDQGQEPLVNDVVLQVRDGQGQLVDTLVSGVPGGFSPGYYEVLGLAPGGYTVIVVDYPAGLILSTPGGDPTLATTLQSGQCDLTLDFPFNSTTAVNVSSFAAQAQAEGITLLWTTSSEPSNQGFHILRASSPDGAYLRLTDSPVPSQSVGGQGASYQWQDQAAQPGRAYWYRLETVPDGLVIGPVQARMAGGRIFLPVLARTR